MSIRLTEETAPDTPPSGKVVMYAKADGLMYAKDDAGTETLLSNAVSGITELTGDVAAGPGSGSQAATLATVNSNVGSFTNASVTVNAKGLITAASSGAAATAGGADTNVQYNDGGVFGGDANNTWNKTTKLHTLTQAGIAATVGSALLLQNTTAATVGTQVQVSPAVQWSGRGWKTNATAASQSVDFRASVLPITASASPRGEWRLAYSVNGAAYSTGLSYFTTQQDGITQQLFSANGLVDFSVSNSSTVGTLANLTLSNSGTRTHYVNKFSGNLRSSWTTHDNGYQEFKAIGSGPIFQFQTGPSLGSENYRVEISEIGLFCPYKGLFGGVVTAGIADVSATATLSSAGSFAVKGVVITDATYTIGAAETMVYVDSSSTNFCSGTPSSACSSHGSEGACTSHSEAGCSWFAGSTCNTYNGTDQGTCETGHTGCTWSTSACSFYNNYDETSCTNQNSPYGGTCSWDTSTCPGFTDSVSCGAVTGCTWNDTCSGYSDQGSCESNSCVWNYTSCNDANGTDQGTCEARTGCTWDSGMNECNGQYNTSCVGGNCTGNLCTGTFFNGDCGGVWGVGCVGTATCEAIDDSGTCAAETGCTWVSGATLTLPIGTTANRSNLSRLYSIVSIGTGTITINPDAADTIYQHSQIKLYKAGDRVLLHHVNVTANCSGLGTEGACEAETGCTWTAAVTCSDYNGDESTCTSYAPNCSYSEGVCSGAGVTAGCSGTYISAKQWVVHNLERSKTYVEKTSSYTLTILDDIVNFTSGTSTATLPSAVTTFYKEYLIVNSSGNTVTMASTSSQTINGGAAGSTTIANGSSKTFISTGTNWVAR